MMAIVYLALGTNLGERLANLQAARAGMAPAARILECSPVYETAPWGDLDQPFFLNQVIKTETDLPPEELLVYVKNLETRLGRVPGRVNGPRLIDIDIIFYDDLILETPVLSLPHPRLAGRAFVLAPLADIAPELRHPAWNKTVSELLAECDTQGIHPYPDAEQPCN
jgi:2-amino-4-hydroxy-6-hydroxymethyldihydropteridine diphosphokinase